MRAKRSRASTFSKQHERKSYQLSRRIWWNEAVKESDNEGAKKTDPKGEEKGSGGGSISVSRTTDECRMMMGQQWIGETEEWNMLKEQEFKAAMNQLNVRVGQYEQVLSYMRNKFQSDSSS